MSIGLSPLKGFLSLLVDFPPFFSRETTFMTSCLFPCTLSSSGKEAYLERKAFASKEQIEGCNSNIFLKPLFRGNLDPFVNNANLGAIAHMSNGT